MEKLEFSRNEVLRYLGYRNQAIDEKLEQKTDQLMEEIKVASQVKCIFDTFPIKREKGSIFIGDGQLELPGTAISRHLENSEECILMAATLGTNVDKRIRYYGKFDVAKALIFDACATAYIEAACDELCRKIDAELFKKGQSLTFRFSPGYGNLPISIQKNFLKALDAEKKIGLTASSANILMPGKSVTAVMGIVDKVCRSNGKSGCLTCSKLKECAYSRMEE
jgi:hypothetical protein